MKKLLFGLVFLASVSSFAKGYECTNKELANITAITAVMEMIKDKEPKNAAKADVMLNVITQGLKTLANESADEAPTNDESLKRNIFLWNCRI